MSSRTVFAPRPLELSEPRFASTRYGDGRVGRLLGRTRTIAGDLRQPFVLGAYERSDLGRSTIALLDSLRGSQAGRVGLIVGNGPSVNITSLSSARELPYILLNRGYLLRDRFDTHPIALCVHDPYVLENFRSELSQLETNLFLPETQVQGLERDGPTAGLRIARRWLFAEHLGLSIHHGHTVTFWGLQVGYLLGWRKAILVGIDHRFAGADRPSRVETAGAADSDHFAVDYFPEGARFLNPNLVASEYSFELAKHAWEAAGREIVDCTPGGALTVFRKSSLEKEAVIG